LVVGLSRCDETTGVQQQTPHCTRPAACLCVCVCARARFPPIVD
jgi:hypothetical protein